MSRKWRATVLVNKFFTINLTNEDANSPECWIMECKEFGIRNLKLAAAADDPVEKAQQAAMSVLETYLSIRLDEVKQIIRTDQKST